MGCTKCICFWNPEIGMALHWWDTEMAPKPSINTNEFDDLQKSYMVHFLLFTPNREIMHFRLKHRKLWRNFVVENIMTLKLELKYQF